MRSDLPVVLGRSGCSGPSCGAEPAVRLRYIETCSGWLSPAESETSELLSGFRSSRRESGGQVRTRGAAAEQQHDAPLVRRRRRPHGTRTLLTPLCPENTSLPFPPQQVDSPSPVFPEERPVHGAEEQASSLDRLPGGPPGPAPTRRYHSVTCGATVRLRLRSAAFSCLWQRRANQQAGNGQQAARRRRQLDGALLLGGPVLSPRSGPRQLHAGEASALDHACRGCHWFPFIHPSFFPFWGVFR